MDPPAWENLQRCPQTPNMDTRGRKAAGKGKEVTKENRRERERESEDRKMGGRKEKEDGNKGKRKEMEKKAWLGPSLTKA